ncbi:hypothetical protein QGM71_12435 [Virgibacillus sp. C22-A2]|uniref:Uncharacterized protein n=1 Tax=Virgibacillus tibetensis TaxID=3042313 RepID=A0ABU6KHG8_9BACI|nr:hypothetical protein [Virgibacillus sp. C22-A2]
MSFWSKLNKVIKRFLPDMEVEQKKEENQEPDKLRNDAKSWEPIRTSLYIDKNLESPSLLDQ